MFVIVRNDPFVPPGYLLDIMEEENCEFVDLAAYEYPRRIALERPTGLIVLGGRMSVYDVQEYPHLSWVRSLIEDALTREIPFLGICLGGQLLASVLGAAVHLRTRGEKGLSDITLTLEGKGDPLFENFDETFPSFHWHSDSFDLPPGSIRLAKTPVCPNQAFRWGKAAYGLQFHPEITPTIVSTWIDGSYSSEGDLLQQLMVREEEYMQTSRLLFRNFIRISNGR